MTALGAMLRGRSPAALCLMWVLLLGGSAAPADVQSPRTSLDSRTSQRCQNAEDLARLSELLAEGEADATGHRRLAREWAAAAVDPTCLVQALRDLKGRGVDPVRVVESWFSAVAGHAVGRAVAEALSAHVRTGVVARAVVDFLGPAGYRTATRELVQADLPVLEPGGSSAGGVRMHLGVALATAAATASRLDGTWLSGENGGRRLAEDGGTAAAVFYLARHAPAVREDIPTGSEGGSERKDGRSEVDAYALARSARWGASFDPAFLVGAARTAARDQSFGGSGDDPTLRGMYDNPYSWLGSWIGHSQLQSCRGPWLARVTTGLGRARPDSFYWLMRSAAEERTGAQAILGDAEVRRYILLGPGSMDWRGPAAQDLLHAATMLPVDPLGRPDQRAADVAAAVIATSATPSAVLRAEVLPAVGRILGGYMPAAFVALGFGKSSAEETGMAADRVVHWPAGAAAVSREDLDMLMRRISGNLLAQAAVTRGLYRFTSDLLLSSPDGQGFADRTRTVVRLLLALEGISQADSRSDRWEDPAWYDILNWSAHVMRLYGRFPGGNVRAREWFAARTPPAGLHVRDLDVPDQRDLWDALLSGRWFEGRSDLVGEDPAAHDEVREVASALVDVGENF